MQDEHVLLAAISQGQIESMAKSKLFEWQFEEPYHSILRAAFSVFVRTGSITLVEWAAECKNFSVPQPSMVELGAIFREYRNASPVSWQVAAERIIRVAMAKRGVAVATELKRLIESGVSPRDALSSAHTKLATLLDNGTVYNPSPSYHYYEGTTGLVKCRTGLLAADTLLRGGVWTQALVGVTLPSNHGKSTLCYTVIGRLIMDHRKCVLFTFETNTATAVARILSVITGLPIAVTIEKRGRTDEENDRLSDAVRLADQFLKVYDSSFNYPDRIRQVIHIERPDVVWVDHLGMIDPRSAERNASRNDQTGDMADAALQWSIKYSLTIFLNAQMSNARQQELKKHHDLEHTEFFGSSRVYNALDFAIIGLRHWVWPNSAYFRLKKNRKDGVVDIDAVVRHDPYTQAYYDKDEPPIFRD